MCRLARLTTLLSCGQAVAVMIGLSAQYAVRALVHIAGADEMHTADNIANHTGIPRGYLAKILQRLHQSGLVNTQRGLHGGYELARSAASISVLDVVRAVEPRSELSMCSECRSDSCRIVSFMRSFGDSCDEKLRLTMIDSFISDCSAGTATSR